ncbi:hypothetical protein Tco_0714532 [Tanacetum coccineum]
MAWMGRNADIKDGDSVNLSRGGRYGERRGRRGGRDIGDNGNIGNDGNNGDNDNNGGNPDIAAMIAQQLQALLPTIVTQISNSAINQRNGNGGCGDDNSNEGNNDGVHEHCNLRNGDNNYNGNGCTYKEFLACKPKEFDGKGGVLAYTRWVKKMESMIDINNFTTNQRVKNVVCSLTEKALTWLNTVDDEEVDADKATKVIYLVDDDDDLINLEAETHDGYDFLNKIEVLREDNNNYIFSEEDFRSVNLNDVKDLFLDRMVRRHEPQSLLHLRLVVSLKVCMRALVIKKKISDLQVGIKSYQYRLNLTKPTLTFDGIEA